MNMLVMHYEQPTGLDLKYPDTATETAKDTISCVWEKQILVRLVLNM